MEQRKDIMTGIIRILILFIVGSIFLAIAGYILSFVIDIIGRIIVFVLQWAVFGGIAWYGYKYFKKPKPKEKPAEVIPEEAIRLYTSSGQPIVIGNPFRGIFVLGAAGSGKSESIAVPLLSEFIRNGFSGLVYDFKFHTLGQDAFLICTYKGILVAMYCQSQSFVYGDWHKLRFERMCDCGNPTCGEIRLFLAVVQPEKIQQGVQHFTHAVRRFLNVSDIRPGFIRIAVFPHQSGITRYCRQWCT